MPALMKRTLAQLDVAAPPMSVTGNWELDETIFGAPAELPAMQPSTKKLKLMASPSGSGLSVSSYQPLQHNGQDSLAAMVSLVSTPPSIRKQMSGYLDLNLPPSADAVVPSASDLVTAEMAWLPDSMPGSPVPNFGSSNEDDVLSSPTTSIESGARAPSDTLPDAIANMFGTPGESTDLTSAFDAALLDAADGPFHNSKYAATDGVGFGNDDILFTIDTVAPRAPPPTRETSPEPHLTTVAALPLHIPLAAETSVLPAQAAQRAKQNQNKPKKSHKSKAEQAAAALRAKMPKKKSKAAIEREALAAAAAAAASRAASEDSADSMSESHPEESDKAKTIRFVHNSTERKRRCEIRRLFGDLRDLFPNLKGDERTSNITTLTSAITHIAELVQESAQQERELAKLRRRNAALKSRQSAVNRTNSSMLPDVRPIVKRASPVPVLAPRPAASAPIIPQQTESGCVEAQQVFSSPVEALAAGAVAAVAPEDKELRKSLPPALRELLDHNGRGSSEILQPRRRRAGMQ